MTVVPIRLTCRFESCKIALSSSFELFAGVKVEIFARLAPIDFAFAFIIGPDVPLELGKQRVRVLELAGITAPGFAAGLSASLSSDTRRDRSQRCFTVGQALSLSGRAAFSAGTVARSLR